MKIALAQIKPITVMSIFYKKRKFVLFHSYFPRGFLFKLCLRLKILPGANSFLSKEIKYPQAMNRNDLDNLNIKSKGDSNIKSFESFLSDNILKDLPIAYLEGYKALIKIQSKLFDAENIFTANAHFASELFKVWSAEQKSKGSKLIISTQLAQFVSGSSGSCLFNKIAKPFSLVAMRTIFK